MAVSPKDQDMNRIVRGTQSYRNFFYLRLFQLDLHIVQLMHLHS